jgi:hypothetical protein
VAVAASEQSAGKSYVEQFREDGSFRLKFPNRLNSSRSKMPLRLKISAPTSILFFAPLI